MGKYVISNKVKESNKESAKSDKMTKSERQALKREAAELVLDQYFETNIHIGIEHLKSLRAVRPEATPREIMNIMRDGFLDGLKTAEHASSKATLYQDFILGVVALHGSALSDTERRLSMKLLISKQAGLKRSRALKGVANGVGIAVEIGLEIFPIFKNAKFLKKFKNIKPAAVEKGAKRVAQVGVAAVGKLINTPKGSNGDLIVDKLHEIVGSAPKAWPKPAAKKTK